MRRRWLCSKWRKLLVWQAHQEASPESHVMSEGEPECIVFDRSQAFQVVNAILKSHSRARWCIHSDACSHPWEPRRCQ